MRFLLSILVSLFLFVGSALADRAVQVDFMLAGLTDSSGEPLSGGKVYTYESGTSTPRAVYTTQNQSASATNPVILDASGRAQVFALGAYKFVIKDASDVTLYTWDNLQYIQPTSTAIYAGTSSGSSNTYAVTPSPAVTAYVDGLPITFIANHATSGAATLNVSSLGAKALVKSDGTTALGVGDITSGMIVNALYVAGSNHFRLINTAGTVPISGGGTGSTTAAGARTNMGIGTGDSPTMANLTLSGLTASLPLTTDASKQLTSMSAATFKSTYAIAANGANTDITTVNGIALRTDWTPTMSASGSMTISGATAEQKDFQRIGPYVFFELTLKFAIGGTASNIINIGGLPITPVDHDTDVAFACSGDESVSGVPTGIPDLRWRVSGGQIIVFKAQTANFSLGSNATIHIQGWYRAV